MSVCLFRRSTRKYLSDAAVQSDGDELGGKQVLMEELRLPN